MTSTAAPDVSMLFRAMRTGGGVFAIEDITAKPTGAGGTDLAGQPTIP